MGSSSVLSFASSRALVVAVSLAQPGCCTFIGAGAGFVIGSGGPGPYEQRLVGSGKRDVHSLQRLDVSPGDLLQVLLKSGARVEGEYVRVDAPTASDPEMYVVLEGVDEQRGLKCLPFSTVESIGVEVVDYGWIGGGAAVGLALDIVYVALVSWAVGMSS